ncbi:hypothetical protein [Blastococcus sp. TF02A-26]|uniref:hypothetical protein n=1 Tax=Blastococcus sp. TF02A-26 TaxID=2250577 RepID=UPI000DEB53CB|nr:hypothetical protein [Blastococcus sp. TF02A-26]RBY80723.1 hypothetical protein DQ240_21440 [Blastococcus sp. TF02A-26]
MADVSDLVRRRLWELRRSPQEAARRSRWEIPAQVLELMARGGSSFVAERLARPLARALDVPESRLRRVAELPQVPDPRAEIDTRPHLTVVRQER